jgi:hypothetical protein
MAIDGAVNGSASAASTILPGLTTTHSNAVIIVMFTCNVNCTVNSATSTHLTFTSRAFSGNFANALFEYCAIASSPLTAEAITVAGSGTTTYVEGTAFGISGAHTAACPNGPFDTNGALPWQATSGNASITTSNANDMLLVGARGGSNSCTSGFTTVVAGSFTCTQYKIVSSTQPGISVTDPNSNNGIIGDAVLQGP